MVKSMLFVYILKPTMGRILVADDEEHLLSVMVDVLEAAGHEVIGVNDGAEALRQLQIKAFDVAILDVMMPKIDGYHLAQQVHSFVNQPHIVIVSARSFEGDRHAVQAAGAAAFLSKPFANKELVEVVANLLKPQAA